MKTELRQLLMGALLFTTGALSQADVILKVDITDYNDIRFWATGEFALTNVTGYDAENGISLIGILTQNHNGGANNTSSSLKASGMFQAYDFVYAVDFFGSSRFSVAGLKWLSVVGGHGDGKFSCDEVEHVDEVKLGAVA
ncbi:MAG: hypothetical protein IT578_12390, partial [Verrucomicrobiae bacterium]|nr:hypothetical protein [Verrucomicrobiae bacterium]